MQPALLRFANELSATLVRIFAYVGAVVLLVVVAGRIFDTPSVEAAIEPAARSDWQNVERPYRAFSVTVPEFAEPMPGYAIRRHASAGGRKDVMTWGAPDGAGSRLMIEVYRPGAELKRFGEPAAEIAIRTAGLGQVGALTPADAIESKFGRVTTFDFTAGAGERVRQCLGFVRAFGEPRLQLSGWYCKGGAEVVERATLSCALERLSLVMAASEPKVQELFARAETRRKFCAPKPAFRTATTLRRNDWIEAPKTPKLRGRVAAR